VTAVVDTSVLIDHLRGRDDARRVLGEIVDADEQLLGSVLTRAELLAGARSAERPRIEALLGVVEWMPVTLEIADRAGELARECLRSHPGIDTVDYVIAATVEQTRGRLLTRNVEHFPMLPGLAAAY